MLWNFSKIRIEEIRDIAEIFDPFLIINHSNPAPAPDCRQQDPLVLDQYNKHVDHSVNECLFVYRYFTSYQDVRSYQDGYQLVIVHAHGNFIMLPHWDTGSLAHDLSHSVTLFWH